MAHMGRPVKNVEAPRPLKSQPLVENNFMLIEELMQLIENVAHSLKTGVNDMESISALVPNLRVHGPQMETLSKGTLDRAFVVFRNSSQDERLNLMTRLNLLELIELRAKGWEDTGINSYYKTKLADANENQEYVDQPQAVFFGTSPIMTGICNSDSIGSANQQQLLLHAGDVIRNSGKFSKPTRIPGKTYCKDEVVIRNADSGKVMGIKGRRVHMIEELSETVISFQRVNPGAKERLVQITGPAEDKINFAKQLIEDTIRRNASPLKFAPNAVSGNTGEGGSCSSLASSNSDEPMLTRVAGVSNLTHSKNLNSLLNSKNQQRQINASTPIAAGGKSLHAAKPISHSYSTSDASLGEYKFTCEVGDRLIKITGDCCDLVRIAKVVLDDYFGSAEFAEAVKSGAVFNNSSISPISTPSTSLTANSKSAMNTYTQISPLAADSGIGLNYLSSISNNNIHLGDDEVFADAKSLVHNNSLARSRRSHFSRKDSTPEVNSNVENQHKKESARIVHHYEHLLYYAKSPHSWVLPADWRNIREKFPSIIRNTNLHDESDRFNAERYLEFIKSSNRRNITDVEETATADVGNLNIE